MREDIAAVFYWEDGEFLSLVLEGGVEITGEVMFRPSATSPGMGFPYRVVREATPIEFYKAVKGFLTLFGSLPLRVQDTRSRLTEEAFRDMFANFRKPRVFVLRKVRRESKEFEFQLPVQPRS